MKNLTIFTASATRPNLLVNAADDRIEPPAGWSISAENPEDIIHGFSQLKIKKEYKLRGYQYFSGGNGNGIVWAIPASEELPHPDFCDRLDEMFLGPPKPEIALAILWGRLRVTDLHYLICRQRLHGMNFMNLGLCGMAVPGDRIGYCRLRMITKKKCFLK